MVAKSLNVAPVVSARSPAAAGHAAGGDAQHRASSSVHPASTITKPTRLGSRERRSLVANRVGALSQSGAGPGANKQEGGDGDNKPRDVSAAANSRRAAENAGEGADDDNSAASNFVRSYEPRWVGEDVTRWGAV